ncbi:hypothetical protein IFM89_030700 [Coptis chinensis]|uniref:Uncharacterized protein n=1 Tax=Coptis chinensis TaxID=261450 RepID=A0A835MDU2_9MAGN|nr:hypothetical protein IFM89_030700 [Coptis chinensis]
MKKKRRSGETTLSKSSSQRKTIQENHQQTKNIGCMSGIFHLVSKYHQRRKFLTSGDKKDKTVISPHIESKQLPENDTPPLDTADFGKFPCNVKRSPTIASEIRRLVSTDLPANSRDVVAQLLRPNGGPSSAETVPEKRRKLMESLQKCEDDLNTLKKIIESVQSTSHVQLTIPKHVKKCLDVNNEQPSPVSVLDDISCSPSPIRNRSSIQATGCTEFFHKITLEALPLPRFSHRKEDEQYDYLSSATRASTASPFCSSKAKVDSVTEVCQEAVWEETWELRRIGMMLEDYMFGDLIEEMVKELGCCDRYALPFEVCRRRLAF